MGGFALAALLCIAAILVAAPKAYAYDVADNTYEIRSRCCKSVWDVTGGSTAAGALIQGYEFNDSAAQRWKIATDADGVSTITNPESGLVLDIAGGAAVQGARLQLSEPNGSATQQWKLVAEDWWKVKIVSAANELLVIDLANSSSSNGAAILLWADSGGQNQIWSLYHKCDTAYTVSDEQTEMFDTWLYLEDGQSVTPVVESLSDGWEKGNLTADGSGRPGAYYTAGEKLEPFWNSAAVTARYDRIGKVNGRWVSLRLKVRTMHSVGLNYADVFKLPNGKSGSGVFFDPGSPGILLVGLSEARVQMQLLDSESGAAISMDGGYVTFGSLNGTDGDHEFCGYLASTNCQYKTYVVESNNLQRYDNTGEHHWATSEDGWEDRIGSANYNRNCISYLVVEDSPVFEFGAIGDINACWQPIFLGPLTAAVPPSPEKSAEITG